MEENPINERRRKGDNIKMQITTESKRTYKTAPNLAKSNPN